MEKPLFILMVTISSIMIFIFFAFLFLPLTIIAQEGLRADFVFTQDTPDCGSTYRQFAVSEIVDNQLNGSSLGTVSGCSFNFVIKFAQLVSADRQGTTITNLHADFVDAPISLDSEFDLGFDGIVPYTLTILEAQVVLSSQSFSLTPGLSFLEKAFPIEATIIGTVEMEGKVFPIKLVGTSSARSGFNGDLDIAQDLSSMSLNIHCLELGFQGNVFSTEFKGHTLDLKLIIDIIRVEH
jgi:hypothetical protein